MKQYKLIVSTPQGNVYENSVGMLSLRGTEGSLAIMANHIPFITTTKEGEVKIIDCDENELIAEASNGLLTVTTESVTLLCGKFTFKDE